MSAREFSEWMAFYTLEPFGPERDDLRIAILDSIVANATRDPKKSRVMKPGDFMPEFGKAQQTPDQQLQIAEALNAMFGGADTRMS